MHNRLLQVLVLGVAITQTGCPQFSDIEIPVLMTSKVSEEEVIAAVLDDVQRGIESKKIYKVLAHVSKDYHDQEGRDYIGIQSYLNYLFKEYKEIRITRTRPRIIVEGLRAKAFETFGTQAKPINPASGRPIDVQGHVTVYLEKTGGMWQIVEWGPIQ
ncbi:MAG TPA: hypothetical protein PKY35_00110 [Candidatus Hydrogenedentes bacterium]|nr:hypothetical protein [Candidatus Hydrogenedentota bacterium]HOL75404.1 hypothetical protein [Candidatus Hydrogenedentota bacterium]HPO84913.1 hypothetical protein [Candidatus Hydrogenedentota bacterium]